MQTLIFKEDCDLFSASAGTEEMINDLITEYHFTENEMTDLEKIYKFAYKLLEKAQNYIDSSPVISTDEAIAIKCPECKNIYIEYDNIYRSFCPVCGIKHSIGGIE